jgi:signal transduction histidine kinase
VTLTVDRRDAEVSFRVEDTGPGIAPEHLPRLFDRFWQARESRRGGAGLGLVIARGIAEGHGGRVEVQSRLGHGSAFTLVLPEQP